MLWVDSSYLLDFIVIQRPRQLVMLFLFKLFFVEYKALLIRGYPLMNEDQCFQFSDGSGWEHRKVYRLSGKRLDGNLKCIGVGLVNLWWV